MRAQTHMVSADEVLNLLSYPATRKQRMAALAVCGVLIATGLAAMPVARHALPVIAPFLSLFIAFVVFAGLAICTLLTSQYRVSRVPSLIALAATYLLTSLFAAVYLATFPGAFSPTGLFGARPESSSWLWVFWHVGYSAGVLAFLAVHVRFGDHRPSRAALTCLMVVALAVTLALFGGFTLFALRSPAWLPTIIRQDDYRALVTSGVGVVVWELNLAACICLCLVWRGRTVGHLWLTVAALATLLEVTLSLAGGNRYSVGWYVGRFDSLSASVVVFCALLFETHRLYDRIVEQGRELRAIFDSSSVGIARVGINGRTLQTNTALCALLAYRDEELRAVPLDALMAPEDAMRDCEYRVELLAGGREHYELESRFTRNGGEQFWAQVHVSLVRGRRGEPLYFVTLVDNISERKQHEESVNWQAYHDALTGLANRIALTEGLTRALESEGATRVGIVYLDLDGFKQVNDTLGHDAGDDLLREVARRLADCVRAGDLAARMGGDEFVLLLPGLSHRDDTQRVVHRVVAALAQPIIVQGQAVSVGASIGVSVFPDDGADSHALLTGADAEMYRAKMERKHARLTVSATDAAD